MDASKNLDEYLRVSKAWLMDTVRAHDLAIAGARLVSDAAVRSRKLMPERDEGPIFTWVQEGLDFNVPIALFPGTQFMRAMWLVHEGNLDVESLHIPSLSPSPERGGAIVCRGGIIAQFELWKQFAAVRAYPSNGKAATKHRDKGYFSGQDEQSMLTEVIDLRNQLTHEPDISSDPDAKALVEYTNKLHHLADWIHRLHEAGATNHWLSAGLRRT